MGLLDDIYCTVCGYVVAVREVISALGHNYHTHNGKEPTCTEQGNMPFTADRKSYDESCSKSGETNRTEWFASFQSSFPLINDKNLLYKLKNREQV